MQQAITIDGRRRLERFQRRRVGRAIRSAKLRASKCRTKALSSACWSSILSDPAPFNWLLFKMLGRVEWAWIAAPAIALVRAACVIKLAQLDIGFAGRSEKLRCSKSHAGHAARPPDSLHGALHVAFDFLRSALRKLDGRGPAVCHGRLVFGGSSADRHLAARAKTSR